MSCLKYKYSTPVWELPKNCLAIHVGRTDTACTAQISTGSNLNQTTDYTDYNPPLIFL